MDDDRKWYEDARARGPNGGYMLRPAAMFAIVVAGLTSLAAAVANPPRDTPVCGRMEEAAGLCTAAHPAPRAP